MKVKFSRRARRTVAWSALALAVAGAAAGCTSSSTNGNAAEAAAQGTASALLEQNQPLPIFTTSAYRYELIQIEAIEALGTPTTAFFFPEGTTVVNVNGKMTFSAPPIKVCGAEGEPIPNTASLSNPDQVVNGQNGTSDVIGQIDPNGTYVPASSSGTYVLCDSSTGGQKLTYWEGPVFDESGAAIWSDTQGIVDIGPSALPACTVETSTGADDIKAGTRYYHCVDTTGKAVNSSGL